MPFARFMPLKCILPSKCIMATVFFVSWLLVQRVEQGDGEPGRSQFPPFIMPIEKHHSRPAIMPFVVRMDHPWRRIFLARLVETRLLQIPNIPLAITLRRERRASADVNLGHVQNARQAAWSRSQFRRVDGAAVSFGAPIEVPVDRIDRVMQNENVRARPLHLL